MARLIGGILLMVVAMGFLLAMQWMEHRREDLRAGAWVQLKRTVTLGRLEDGELIQDGDPVPHGAVLKYLSSDGMYVQLPGGYVDFDDVDFLISWRTAKFPNDARRWDEGTTVVRRHWQGGLEYFDRVNDQLVKRPPPDSLEWTVLEDRGDGHVLLRGSDQEVWVRKRGLVHIDDAMLWWNLRVEVEPQSVGAVASRAHTSMERGDWEQATADFTRAIELDPDEARHYYHRGIAWYHRNQLDEALADFTAAIERDPNHGMAYSYRGDCWSEKADFQQALADYSRAIELESYSIYFLDRGTTRMRLNQVDEAIADFTKAIELDADSANAYGWRGHGWMEQQDYERAIADFTRAVELAPRAAYFRLRADAWMKQQRFEQAIEDLNQALSQEPYHVQARVVRGRAYAAAGRCGRGLVDMEAAYDLDNEHREAQVSLAWFLATCPEALYRDGPRAVQLAEAAVEQAGDEASWRLWEALAAAAAEVGDWERAQQEQRRALRLAMGSGDDNLESEVQARLELYESRQPYRAAVP